MCDFKKALVGKTYLLTTCTCDERIQLMGLREGSEIKITEECPFGGTVIVETRFGKFCVRRKEVCAELEEVD
jgi:Fe2+ transport system protein FeoA